MSGRDKTADISDLIATFSSHLRENYPDPGVFRENLASLLSSKRERMEKDEYVLSLERNLVFLQELTVEAEALLEVLLGSVNEQPPPEGGYLPVLEEMETKVREVTSERHRETFVDDGEAGYDGLRKLKEGDRESYVERLEFHYSLLMTLRIFLFEFFNVLAAVAAGHRIDRIDDAAPGLVTSNIEMTANYYLGNISVGEVVEGEGEDGERKAPPGGE